MTRHPFISGRWLKQNNLQENENWHIKRNLQYEITSFCYVPHNNVESIILGSFPIYEMAEGENRNNHLEFFYGSNDNKFWPILKTLLKAPIETIKDRINLLNRSSLGITDILFDLERNPFNSHSDRDLFPIKYNNIIEILTNFSRIKNIFITSGGVAEISTLNGNNKSVATWFRDSIMHKHPIGFNHNGFVKKISVSGMNFNLIYLYSPSPQANISLQGILNSNNYFGNKRIDIEVFRTLQWCYFLNSYHFKGSNNHVKEIADFINQNNQLVNLFKKNGS